MTIFPSTAIKLLVTLLVSLVFVAEASNPATIQEFAIAYPETSPCASGTSQGALVHPESTHEITYDQSDRSSPFHLWVTGQKDDAVVRVGMDGSTRIYEMPPCSGPHGITFDRRGRLWVSLEFAGKVVQLLDRGSSLVQVEAYDVRLNCASCAEPINSHPHGLAVGADGETLWFTGKATGTIGKIDADGNVEMFSLPTVGSVPIYIKAGPDGNMWFTELVGNAVGRITPDGTVTEFPIPTPNSRPIEIVPEPGGAPAMWFTEEAGNKVGRITVDGTITEFPVPKMYDNVILGGLAFDAEGNLWVQGYVDVNEPTYVLAGDKPAEPVGHDYLVKIDRSILEAGASEPAELAFTFYIAPSQDTVMHRIIRGPDGNMWFTELRADKVGKLTLERSVRGEE